MCFCGDVNLHKMSKALLNFASDYVSVNTIDNLWYNLYDKVLDEINTLCSKCRNSQQLWIA